VLPARFAVEASSAGAVQPGDSDTRTCAIFRSVAGFLDEADYLVTGDDSAASARKLAFNDMQVGAADAAGQNPNPTLSLCRLGHRNICHAERILFDRLRTFEDACLHRVSSLSKVLCRQCSIELTLAHFNRAARRSLSSAASSPFQRVIQGLG